MLRFLREEKSIESFIKLVAKISSDNEGTAQRIESVTNRAEC